MTTQERDTALQRTKEALKNEEDARKREEDALEREEDAKVNLRTFCALAQENLQNAAAQEEAEYKKKQAAKMREYQMLEQMRQLALPAGIEVLGTPPPKKRRLSLRLLDSH